MSDEVLPFVPSPQADWRDSSRLMLGPEQLGSDQVPGSQIASIIRKLKRECGNTLQSVVFHGLQTSGPIDLCMEDHDTIVHRLGFMNCTDVELVFAGTHLSSLELVNCGVVALAGPRSRIDDAISLRDCRFGGTPALPNTAAIGLQAASIDFVFIDDCTLAATHPNSRILLDKAIVSKEIRLSGLSGFSQLSLLGAKLGAGAELHDVCIKAEAEDIAIQLTSLHVTTRFVIQGCSIDGLVRADNISVGDHWHLRSCQFSNASWHSFHAEGVRVGGAFIVGNCQFNGTFFLIHARVGVNVQFSNCQFNNSQGAALDLFGSRCEGDLVIDDGTACLGQLSMWHFRAGGHITVRNIYVTSFSNSDEFALRAIGVEARRILLADSRIERSLSLADSSISGDAYISNIYFTKSVSPAGSSVFDGNLHLNRAQIAGTLRLGPIDVDGIGQCDAGHAQCGVLDIAGYIDRDTVLLDLNGLEYASIGRLTPGDIARATQLLQSNEKKKFGLMTALAGKQGKRFAFYGDLLRSPLAHTHLARLLASAGLGRESTQVIRQRNRLMRNQPAAIRRPLSWLGSFLFDKMFGYGYSPARATLVVLLWVLLGWWSVAQGIDRGVLVIDPSYVVTLNQGATGKDIGKIAGLPSGSLSCRGVVEPLFLAIDLILPVIDLGQRTKCSVAIPGTGGAGFLEWVESTSWFAVVYSYTIIGWVLVTLAALTFAGVLRDDPNK